MKKTIPQTNLLEVCHICTRNSSKKSLRESLAKLIRFILGYDEVSKFGRITNLNYILFLVVIVIYTGAFNRMYSQGINLTGLEQTWNEDFQFSLVVKKIKTEISILSDNRYNSFRIPIDIHYHLNTHKKQFNKALNSIVTLSRKKNVDLILANFNHNLSLNNYNVKREEIVENWSEILALLKGDISNIYIDIANEPNLYPTEWEQTGTYIIKKIREKNPNIKIIYGASNYNSLYELSRSEPLKFSNIIYAFHFYEPYVFTHQGTSWTGNQTKTINIPFPYPTLDTIKMPPLHPDVLGTPGEINYKDYHLTGTFQAVEDKISIMNQWSMKYGVEVWCTEYGVSINADKNSREIYLKCVREKLAKYKIEGFIWEYTGNFGISELKL